MALNSHGLNLMGDYPMKLSHLLTGAAVAALTAGAAVAQVPAAQQPRTTVGSLVTGGGAEFAATNEFASEINLAALTTKVDGNLEMNIDANRGSLFSGLGASDKFTVTINLTGGLTFDAQVTDADHLGDVADPNNDTTPAASQCGLTLQSGGAVGSQQVVFVSTGNPGLCDDDADENLLFDFDVQVTDAGNISVSIDSNGSNLLNETYDGAPTTVAAPALVSRAQGVTVAFAADTTPTAAESTASAAGLAFDWFDANDRVLGTITTTNNNKLIDFGNTLDLDADGALAAATLTVSFPSASSLAGITCNGTTSGSDDQDFATGASSVSCTSASGDITVTDFTGGDTIVVSVRDTGEVGDAISFQQPTISLALTGATNYDLSGSSFSNRATDKIVLENTSVGAPAGGGAFQWVGDGGNVDSVFRCRVTGGAAAAAPRVYAILTNATNGNNGTFDLGNIATSAGELIVTSDTIAAASGPFSRADVNIGVANPASIAAGGCDRLMASPGGTLSDFSADYN